MLIVCGGLKLSQCGESIEHQLEGSVVCHVLCPKELLKLEIPGWGQYPQRGFLWKAVGCSRTNEARDEENLCPCKAMEKSRKNWFKRRYFWDAGFQKSASRFPGMRIFILMSSGLTNIIVFL